MGEVVELDERGRLTIPSELRQMLRGRRVRVERADDNTILIRSELDSEAVLKSIKATSGPAVGVGSGICT